MRRQMRPSVNIPKRKPLTPTRIDRRRKEKKSSFFPVLGIFLIAIVVFGGWSIVKKNGDHLSKPEQKITADMTNKDESEDESENRDHISLYYYNLLNTEEKVIYQQLVEGLSAFENEIAIACNDGNKLNTIYDMVMAEHPEIFWALNGYQYTQFGEDMTVMPNYTDSRDEMEAKQREINRETEIALNFIIEQNPVTEYEKVKAVFEYLIQTVTYRLDCQDNQNIYSALVNKESVCAGYSRTTQYLLQKLGFEVLYVSGEVTGRGSHAWNIVKCNGRYYQLDTTFGDRDYEESIDISDAPAEIGFNYAYLCCTDEEMFRERTVDRIAELPVCNSSDLNYYRLQGRYFDGDIEQAVKSLHESIENGERSWFGQFARKEDYLLFLSKIEEGIYLQTVSDLGIHFESSRYLKEDSLYTISCWYK